MANRKNSHRRRVRVAVLMVLCGAVFAAFFARLAWMQFVRADYYADKAAEASSASYTVTQHAARGAIVDSAGVVLARDTTVYDVYLRIPAPPGTDLRKTVKAIESLTGSKDVETQLAAFFAVASAGELPVAQGVGSDVLTSFYKADLVRAAQCGLPPVACAPGRTARCCPMRWASPGRSRQSSGPLPGGAALRWMLSSGRAGWRPPMTTCSAGRTGGCS